MRDIDNALEALLGKRVAAFNVQTNCGQNTVKGILSKKAETYRIVYQTDIPEYDRHGNYLGKALRYQELSRSHIRCLEKRVIYTDQLHWRTPTFIGLNIATYRGASQESKNATEAYDAAYSQTQ